MWNKIKAILVFVGGLGACYCVGALAGARLGEIAGNLLTGSTDK